MSDDAVWLECFINWFDLDDIASKRVRSIAAKLRLSAQLLAAAKWASENHHYCRHESMNELDIAIAAYEAGGK